MLDWINNKALLRIITITIVLAVSLTAVNFTPQAQTNQPGGLDTPENPPAPQVDPLTAYNVYIPQLTQDFPWVSPFGIESTNPLLESNTLLQRTIDLQVGWVRMGEQVSWAALQPNPGLPPDWSLLATFETELRSLKAAGIRPVVVLKDAPYWALDQEKALDADGNLTSCGAISEQFFGAYASFVQKLVERYSTAEFNVHDWELGNEPDVDPTQVPHDNLFGCWGDISDTQYYGGYHYGRMIVSVAPVIKQIDSRANVWMGGLLLARPDSGSSPDDGYPERFFRGVLEAGAAPYIDIVPYHWYATFWDFWGSGESYDYDIASSAWISWGGGTLGKARYLRQVMAEYGVDKPVFLNESGFGCMEGQQYCDYELDDRFFESQATHLVRFYIRGLSENVGGFFWYTLNGPGWRYTGLLDKFQQPKKVYNAFLYLSQKLHFARFLTTLDYGADIEAYAFRLNSHHVHIVWAREDKTVDFYVPVNKFIEVTDRYGSVIYNQSNPPPQSGPDYVLQVGFEPIYITRYP